MKIMEDRDASSAVMKCVAPQQQAALLQGWHWITSEILPEGRTIMIVGNTQMLDFRKRAKMSGV